MFKYSYQREFHELGIDLFKEGSNTYNGYIDIDDNNFFDLIKNNVRFEKNIKFYGFKFYEKISKFEYFTILNNFPSRALYEVYSELINRERMLFTPKYLIDENDILFKRQYAALLLLASCQLPEISIRTYRNKHFKQLWTLLQQILRIN